MTTIEQLLFRRPATTVAPTADTRLLGRMETVVMHGLGLERHPEDGARCVGGV